VSRRLDRQGCADLDVLVVPSLGAGASAEALEDALGREDINRLTDVLRDGPLPPVVAAACSGTFVLAQGGLLDGHVAVWLHENASATLSDCTFRANSLSGIAAYDDSVAHVSGCTIEGSGHDALFTQHRAVIYAQDTNIVASKRRMVAILEACRGHRRRPHDATAAHDAEGDLPPHDPGGERHNSRRADFPEAAYAVGLRLS